MACTVRKCKWHLGDPVFCLICNSQLCYTNFSRNIMLYLISTSSLGIGILCLFLIELLFYSMYTNSVSH